MLDLVAVAGVWLQSSDCPRFGMSPQRMVGVYAYSYATYSGYHRPAHRHHFAFQLHDALFAGRSRTAQQHLKQQHHARSQAIP